jgi:hypothetical protein
MRKLIVIFLFISCFAVACAPAVTRTHLTASGRPEAIFRNTTIQEVKSKLIEKMLSMQARVVSSDDNTITFSRDMEGASNFWARFLYGNAYSQGSNNVTFTLFEVAPNEIKVVCDQFMEVRAHNASLQHRENVTANSEFNSVMGFFREIGGEPQGVKTQGEQEVQAPEPVTTTEDEKQ